jgi:para-nitrobenzyl esterase
MASRPVVVTTLGAARGSRLDSGVAAFLGLRYAESPSGDGRFAPPAPVSTWGSDPVDATSFGATPPQFEHDRLSLYPPQGEDCLWLNIWTPAADAALRPVMVWIHGGGWLQEGACDTVYSGEYLAARGDVVVVTIEYRTNIFGFCHLADVDGSGNAGLLDQLEGLRWVREHIAAFGGDPMNVTIFGESAGGMSVSALFGLPAARGLFRRAIMQSNVASAVRRADFAAAVTDGVAAIALGGRCGSHTAADLRALTWERLLAAAVEFADGARLGSDVLFGPTCDGAVFGEPPMRASANGLNADLPIMLGFTRDESRYWQDLDPTLADPSLPAELLLGVMAAPALPLGTTVDDLAALLRAGAPEKSPLHIGLSGLDDVFFRMPILRQAEHHARQGRAPAFVYRFDWEPSVPAHPEFDYGSPHAADLGFTLGTAAAYPEMYGGVWSSGLRDQMMDAWIAFARHGDPNHDGLPHWPRYDDDRMLMVFDADADVATSAIVQDPDRDRRLFWQTVPFDGTYPAFGPEDLAD